MDMDMGQATTLQFDAGDLEIRIKSGDCNRGIWDTTEKFLILLLPPADASYVSHDTSKFTSTRSVIYFCCEFLNARIYKHMKMLTLLIGKA